MLLTVASEPEQASLTLTTILSLLGGGALVTAVAGLLGRLWESKTEHSAWLREQRLDAYRRVLRLLYSMRDYESDTREPIEEHPPKPDELTDEQHQEIIERIEEERAKAHTPEGRFKRLNDMRETQRELASLLHIVSPPVIDTWFGVAIASITAGNERARMHAERRLMHHMRRSLKVRLGPVGYVSAIRERGKSKKVRAMFKKVEAETPL